MAKYCCICDKPLGFLSDKIALKDGYLCKKCLKAGGFTSLSSSESIPATRVTEVIVPRIEMVRSYRTVTSFGSLEVDSNSCMFKYEGEVYSFDDLVSYSIHEYPNNIHDATLKAKSSGAAIGGVLGGMGGGLLGGAIGASVGEKVGGFFFASCDYMYITITVRKIVEYSIRIDYIREKTRISSTEYRAAVKRANDLLEGLQFIAAQNMLKHQTNEEEKKQNSERERLVKKEVTVKSGHLTAKEFAEELEIYKNLLYNNDITEEEYEKKKKQLLDMM